MNHSPGRGRSARLWRLLAGSLAGILILAALLLGALRLAIARVPENAARIQAWVEQQTDYRLEFRGVDARLRWWGPEVVLRNLRVIDRDTSQALFETREGAVSLDLWNFFRTGELVAGRVRIVGPSITLVRLADGRIRLLGLRERPADRPPFDFDRLPAGRVDVEDASIVYRDLKNGRGPWQLRQAQLSLRRARDDVDVVGALQLPADLGTAVEFEGRLRGSLDDLDRMQGKLDLRCDNLRLAGLADLLPGRIRPLSGEGPVAAAVAFERGRLQNLRLELQLADVAFAMPPRAVPPVETVVVAEPTRPRGASPMSMPAAERSIVQRPAAALPPEVRYAAIGGRLRLRQEGDWWVFRATDLELRREGQRTVQPASLGVRLHGDPRSAFELVVHAAALSIDDAWPLVLALAPPALDRWAGLDPSGVVRELRADVRRVRAGARPEFQVSADVAALATKPVARWPGLAGITASISGTEQRGRIALRAEAPSFEWPRLFRAPITATRVTADVDWQREGDDWVVSTRDLRVLHPQAVASATASLRVPPRGRSPYLDAEARVESLDATLVRDVLPVGRMQPRSIAWLEAAFQRGTTSDGVLSYHGPVRKFPFRAGEGEFKASAKVRDATLVFFEGFAPLTGAVATVGFLNASTFATVDSGQIGGLRLRRATFALDDYKAPTLDIYGEGSGDLAAILRLLQDSPLGPQIGQQFMDLSGRGPADYSLRLKLPTQDAQARDYLVNARLRSVTVDWPVLRAPATGVTGELEIHNREFRSRSLRGTFLDGPFDVALQPGPVGRDITASVLFNGTGRVSGARLPQLIGLPDTIRMAGTADWRLDGQVQQQGAGGPWPVRVEVTTDLRGLQIDAPRPFAKPAADPRATRVVLEVPARGRTDVHIESGAARAALRFVERGDRRWDLERGAARFDARQVAMPAQAGLHVGGDWPEFDLGEWLALRSPTPGARRLSDWLGPVDVHLDRARVLGFEFLDVTARLEPAADAFRVVTSGPMAEGTLLVPADFSTGPPLRLDMRRLVLQSAPPAPGASPAPATDPRDLPAVVASVEDFAWQGRQFGKLAAVLERVPQGVRLTSLATDAKVFTLDGTGSWLAEGQGSRTRLALEFRSTDLAAASRALGYRDAVDAEQARISADLTWSGGPDENSIARMDGSLRLELDRGQLRGVKPGAGRILGLTSVVELPRRLALDFRDVTDEGLAFDTVRGDFDVRAGNAYTQNVLLKGAAVDVGVVGRTGLAAQDYEQTVVVSGNPSGPMTVAGALAAGPVGAAGALLISQLFKGQLQGLARIYYRVTGSWANPTVERISASAGGNLAAGDAAPKEGRQ